MNGNIPYDSSHSGFLPMQYDDAKKCKWENSYHMWWRRKVIKCIFNFLHPFGNERLNWRWNFPKAIGFTRDTSVFEMCHFFCTWCDWASRPNSIWQHSQQILFGLLVLNDRVRIFVSFFCQYNCLAPTPSPGSPCKQQEYKLCALKIVSWASTIVLCLS